MKISVIFSLLLIMLFGVVVGILPTGAQESEIPAVHDPSQLRPLGRYRLPGNRFMPSPDTFHMLSFTSISVEIPPQEPSESTETVATPEVEPASEPQYESRTILQMYDLRYGTFLWSLELKDHETQSIDFSPGGDTLAIRSMLDQGDGNPENDLYRLIIYDSLTGEVIAESSDLNPIYEARIPGEISQPLMITASYMTDQRLLTSASRPFVGTVCSAWDVHTLEIVWSKPNDCGKLSPHRTYIAQLEPHQSGSAYQQIAIFELASGQRITSSPDEVIGFAWLDDHTIIAYRPYGDPPVVWEILNNTRAAIEQPIRLHMAYPTDALTEMFLPGGEVGYYVWDKTTGDLLRETEINGQLFELDGRIVVLEINQNWSQLRWLLENPDEASEAELMEAHSNLNRAFLLRDFATGAELWAHPYQHNEFRFSPDQTWGYSYDAVDLGIDLFDLRTGQIWGGLPTLRGNFTFTSDMRWVVQQYGNLFTIWGEAGELDRFENQPNSITIKGYAGIYGYPATWSSIQDYFTAGTYLWVVGQAGNGDWVVAQGVDGRLIFLKSGDVKLPIRAWRLPAYH